jgi:hypothetical protein
VQFRSTIFHGSERTLVDFPFADEGGATSTIFLREEAGETEQYLAERLQLYFDYWFGRIEGGDEPQIPITRGEPTGIAVRLSTGAEQARVEVVDGVLHLEAPDEAELERVFWRYLRVLDEKYWAPDLGNMASWLRRAKGDDRWLTWPEND